ncbi:dienelactone hydrolase family protein [Parachryseolinea silvisoli]|uniref:dienelactone hydrolase family protein n=1 Tax=Parachryseolinea silvisoli TaxID=2873601 RepID=UPI002265C340|nr:dienelactone hydrolase family protein [Parachryseolinea silvisoli]MCD9016627.1 dienelactone hydrolase family protein [Parachryseolinea silvisoli]
MSIKRMSIALLSALVLLAACSRPKPAEEAAPQPVEPSYTQEAVSYSLDTTTMNGYVAYNQTDSTKRPGIIVVPEWWGVSDHVKTSANELAKLGYVALVADVYGNGKTADNPTDAGALATPFYQNPVLAKARIDAAIAKLKTYSQVDTTRIGAIGYCFGGGVLLNTARLGDADLKAVVSFHGTLMGGVPAKKETLTAKILVCHGNADPLVKPAEVEAFKKEMDGIGATYTFKAYDSAQHAFTNPAATELGKKFNLPISYNAKADSASWIEMKTFLADALK